MNKFFVFLSAIFCCMILFTGNVFAAEFTPLPENLLHSSALDGGYYNIYYTNSDGKIFCVNTFNHFDPNTAGLEVLVNDNELKIRGIDYNTRYQNFEFDSSSNTWKQLNTLQNIGKDEIKTVTYNVSSFLQSDIDILSETTGEVVFPLPPTAAPTLEEVTAEGLQNLQTETMGTMGTLTIAAVGFLALLIGLVLLPKVLYRFL